MVSWNLPVAGEWGTTKQRTPAVMQEKGIQRQARSWDRPRWRRMPWPGPFRSMTIGRLLPLPLSVDDGRNSSRQKSTKNSRYSKTGKKNDYAVPFHTPEDSVPFCMWMWRQECSWGWEVVWAEEGFVEAVVGTRRNWLDWLFGILYLIVIIISIVLSAPYRIASWTGSLASWNWWRRMKSGGGSALCHSNASQALIQVRLTGLICLLLSIFIFNIYKHAWASVGQIGVVCGALHLSFHVCMRTQYA